MDTVRRVLPSKPSRRYWNYLLVLLHAVVLAALAHFWLRERLNNALFGRIVAGVTTTAMSDKERVLALMATTHRIQWSTKELVGPKGGDGFPHITGSIYMQDPTWLLLAPIGACGSFSAALGRTLERAEIPYRIAIMECGDTHAPCHIMVEARVDGHWAALDPLFNLAFRRRDGRLASFADVSADWHHYQRQIPSYRLTLPPDDEQYYDVTTYDYRGVHYTNWEMIPVVMPIVRSVLVTVLGEARVQALALNTLLYDRAQVGLALALVLEGGLWLLTFGLWQRRKRTLLSRHAEHASGRQNPLAQYSRDA